MYNYTVVHYIIWSSEARILKWGGDMIIRSRPAINKILIIQVFQKISGKIDPISI